MATGKSNFDKKHKSNLDRYEKKIETLYREIIMDIVRLGEAAGFDGEKPFSFSDFPGMEKRVDELLRRLQGEIVTVIMNGTREEWELSADKNGELVDSILGSTGLSKEQISQFKPRNLEALKAFQSRKIAGMNLSQRVWRIMEQGKEDFELALDIGLGEGKSASELSRDIRRYLKQPEKLFRRVRDKRGNLVLSQKAKSYHPGQGVYRSSYKNAVRMTRTEINTAYHEADFENWSKNDIVLGFEIVLSNNHPVTDICDLLAGKYPKTFKFVGWHPQCRCVAVPITPTIDEIIEYTNMIANGEDVSGYRFKGEIKEPPRNFKGWVKDNRERIGKMEARGTLPYFLKDNRTLLSTNTQEKTGVQKLIKELKNPDKIKDAELKDIIRQYASENSREFYGGLAGVQISTVTNYFMANSRQYSMKGEYLSEAGNRIHLTNRTFYTQNGTFNPAESLKGAIGAISKDVALTFNQEYALESLWHEIRHAGAVGWKEAKNVTPFKTTAMELINQFCARKSYHLFVEKLGGKAVNQKAIVSGGYGYSTYVKNFRSILDKYGLLENDAYEYFKDIIQKEPYENIWLKVEDYLKSNGVKNAHKLMMNINRSSFSGLL